MTLQGHMIKFSTLPGLLATGIVVVEIWFKFVTLSRKTTWPKGQVTWVGTP